MKKKLYANKHADVSNSKDLQSLSCSSRFQNSIMPIDNPIVF